MLEITIMYGAVATIFVISLAIGFIKSTRAVIVLGGLLTMTAIACGIFMRNYELVNTVLDYVRTNGKSVFSTPSEWGKLQKEMNLDEKVNYDKLKEYRKLYPKYGYLTSLFGFLAIILSLSMIFIAPYSRLGVFLALVVLLGFMYFVAEFSNKAEHYRELLIKERDKVYNLNYSNIKNIIINDGDEHLQQLVTWWRMCELSAENKEKYSELLRIVNDVCREYVILWR